MATYSREIVAEVIAANDIVDIIGGVLELKPAGGGRHKALCPFHNEKTPSFSVSHDRQMFYCFGCEKSGDVIAFLREYEGLSFVEALKQLADRAGISLPQPDGASSDRDFERTQVLKLTEFAYKFYRSMLKDPVKGRAGRDYLQSRGLRPETEERFGLGFVPEGWNNLTDAAKAAGFKESVLELSALARRGQQGSLYDLFRNRVIVPIRDTSARPVAFGGRDLSGEEAKYINSPENAVYKKGRTLFALDEARSAMRTEKRAILMEGYFDVMRAFDAGVENVVATCGTALTPDQAALIRRYVPEVVVLYDGDAAGVRAALRSIGILAAAGLTVRAMALPDGLDPDDFIVKRGADAFRECVDSAQDFVSFYIERNRKRLETIEGRTDVAKELFTILLDIDDELRREEYLKRIGHRLGIQEWRVRSEFTKVLRAARRPSRMPRNTDAPKSKANFRPLKGHEEDSIFVAAMMHNESLINTVREQLNDVTTPDDAIAEVLDALYEGLANIHSHAFENDEARLLYASAANRDPLPREQAEIVVARNVTRLRRAALQSEQQDVQKALRDAERQRDTDAMMELIGQLSTLKKRIQECGAV